MGEAKDLSVEFPGVVIIHQKIRGSSVDEHVHDDHEFFFPLQGEIQIQTSGATLKAGPGRMTYLPPETPHSFTSDQRSQGERLILIVESPVWKRLDGGKFPAATLPASQLCKEICFQLLIHPKTRAAKSLVETLVQTLSEMLEEADPSTTSDPAHLSSDDPRLRSALELIEENFAGTLSAASLAKASGLSVRNLNRLFLTELGLTPKQVITRHRIEHARKLLEKGDRSVTDVCFDVGYSSVSQFIATFRKHTGQVPSSVRPLR